MIIVVLFIVIVGGCYVIFKAIGEAIFGKGSNNPTYVDKSIHHHHHYNDNRSVHVDGRKIEKLK
jgi:hypothetical protein